MLHPRRGRLHNPHPGAVAAIAQCRVHGSVLGPIRPVLRSVTMHTIDDHGHKLTCILRNAHHRTGSLPPRHLHRDHHPARGIRRPARFVLSPLRASTARRPHHLHPWLSGSVYIFVSIATLIGTPTGGALLKVVDETHFKALVVFTGVILAAGTVALVGAAVVSSVRLREKLGLRPGAAER